MEIYKKTFLTAKTRKHLWIYLALLPTYGFLAVFLAYPTVQAISKSFYHWTDGNYNTPVFVGFKNYLMLFKDIEFWGSFRNLAIFILWSLFTSGCVMLPVSYLVNKLGDSFIGKTIQRLYVIPIIIPSIVFILYWKFFYEVNFGMLNNVLKMLNLGHLTRVWLGEKSTALPALLFSGFPWITGFNACVGGFGFLVLLAGFQMVDKSLHESAELDGANSLVRFIKIDIPLVMPQIKLLFMLTMIGGIQQFALQLVLTQGGPNYATTVPGLVLYFNASKYFNYGYGNAIGVTLFIIILTVTILINKIFKRAE